MKKNKNNFKCKKCKYSSWEQVNIRGRERICIKTRDYISKSYMLNITPENCPLLKLKENE